MRIEYPTVQTDYQLNKRHWNTVTLDGSIPDDEVLEMIDHSYELVVEALPRRTRDALRG